MSQLSSLAHGVYTHDRGLFLRSLAVPVNQRESLIALYALVAELEKVHDAVSEEMIGHIRYAWWQEAVEGLYTGKVARGQPVLEALAPMIASGQLTSDVLMPLIEGYRNAFPQLPPEKDELIEMVSLAWIRLQSPPSEQAWKKTDKLIRAHQRRHGQKRYVWLLMKLLLA